MMTLLSWFATLFASTQPVTAAPNTPAWFWEQTAKGLGGSTSCETGSAHLVAYLRKLPPADIQTYAREFDKRMAESYSWDLWAMAYLANGGASDDGFDYFRGWLILQGKDRFTASLQDPRRALDGVKAGTLVECEDILAVAAQAYDEATEKDLPLSGVEMPEHPRGTAWKEEDLPRLFPDIAKRFGS